MMLVELLKIKYPNIDLFTDVQIFDDGQGPYIKCWNLEEPQPTQEMLEQWAEEQETIEAYNNEQAKAQNQPIYDALNAIDLKSIRAIREGNQERIDALEAEAVALRAQLV